MFLGLAGGVATELAARSGLVTASEAFADRAYRPDGALVSRKEAGSVLHDADAVARRMLRLAEEGVIDAIDGSQVRVEAQSICTHGDSAGAVAMATATRELLESSGVTIEPFAKAAA